MLAIVHRILALVKYMSQRSDRSNAESALAAIKGKFGDPLRSKSDTDQINEALCRVLCHNICVLMQAMHELGVEPSF